MKINSTLMRLEKDDVSLEARTCNLALQARLGAPLASVTPFLWVFLERWNSAFFSQQNKVFLMQRNL